MLARLAAAQNETGDESRAGAGSAALAEGLALADTATQGGRRVASAAQAWPIRGSWMLKGKKCCARFCTASQTDTAFERCAADDCRSGPKQGQQLPLSNTHQAILEAAEAQGLGELDNARCS